MGRLNHETRILIVEDEHFIRSLILHALTKLGFSEISEAQHGDEALSLMADHTFDLVITDIEMKPMNGLELVKMIRSGQAPITKETKVIFLTGFSDFSTLSLAAELDIQGFLVKPASAKQLKDKIYDALKLDLVLKDPDVYKSLSFETDSAGVRGSRDQNSDSYGQGSELGAGSFKDHSVQSVFPHSSIDMKQRVTEVFMDIHKIEPGMILREDVVGRGVLLLSKGTVLKKGHVQVIKDMCFALEQKKILVEVE